MGEVGEAIIKGLPSSCNFEVISGQGSLSLRHSLSSELCVCVCVDIVSRGQGSGGSIRGYNCGFS